MSFSDEIDTFLKAHGSQLVSLKRLAGGASQEVWLVRVADQGESEGGTGTQKPAEREIILRRDMDGALSAMARTRLEEYTLMQRAAEAGIPVPKLFYEPLTLEGRNAFFMEYLRGETIGRRLVQDPQYAAARAALPQQITKALVAIHRIDVATVPFLRTPQSPLDLVEGLERDLDACGEGHPALELGLRWLRLNAPPLERTALVHGDYRLGNFVVGETGLRGVLDWELAHTGDPDEDLGWLCVRAWRFGSDELAAAGITTREELLRLYSAAGGHEVTMERLRYWELFGNVKWGIVALSQAGRHLRGETPSVELATLGRVAAEMEWETLHLLS